MDDIALSVIVGLAVSVLIAGLFGLMWRFEKRTSAARVALAQRRGLLFDEVPARGGRAGRYVFTDTARGMVLEITRPRSSKRSSADGGSVLRLSQPRLQEGLAVWAKGMPAGMGAQMAHFGGMLEMGLVQRLLRKLLGDEIAQHLSHLRDIPQPKGSGLILLTSTDPALLPDGSLIAAALEGLPRRGGANSLAIQGAGGLSLRLTKAVIDPAGIESILEAGLTLQKALR